MLMITKAIISSSNPTHRRNSCWYKSFGNEMSLVTMGAYRRNKQVGLSGKGMYFQYDNWIMYVSINDNVSSVFPEMM